MNQILIRAPIFPMVGARQAPRWQNLISTPALDTPIGAPRAQALLLSGRRPVYFYIILKVGKWPGWCLLTYSLVWTEVGMCRQVTLCKALLWVTSISFINESSSPSCSRSYMRGETGTVTFCIMQMLVPYNFYSRHSH